MWRPTASTGGLTASTPSRQPAARGGVGAGTRGWRGSGRNSGGRCVRVGQTCESFCFPGPGLDTPR
eukprot:4758691-Prymnesium_polylepis.1